MITITTINNSWYFLGDLVIKPNSSSVYDENLLTYEQVKDLLSSLQNKRVQLSEEDVEVLEKRLEATDGHISENEIKTINGISLIGEGDIEIDGSQALSDLQSACHISGGDITITGGNTFSVDAGIGYVRDNNGNLIRIEWDYISQAATQFNGANYIGLDYNKQLVFSTEPISSAYCPLGYIFTTANNSTVIGHASIRLSGKDILYRLGDLFRNTIGSLVESGVSTAMKPEPNGLELTISSGVAWHLLNKFYVSETSSFTKLYNSIGNYFFVDNTDLHKINNTHYNNISNPQQSALVEMTTDFYKKDMILVTPGNRAYYVYGMAEYATEDEAKSAPLPLAPESIKHSVIRSAALIVQKNCSTPVAILDIRPMFTKLFDSGVIASNATVISHNDLVNLSDDAHLQYHNDTRGDERYYRKSEVDSYLLSKSNVSHSHTNATETTTGFMSAADKLKLNGIQAGATLNSGDTFLLDRNNHTGTQSSNTISDFNSSVTSLINNKITNQITQGDTTTAPTQGVVYTALSNKADSIHSHNISSITNLQSSLDNKSPVGHLHSVSDISGLESFTKTTAVSDNISEGVTDKAPSQNSVFIALSDKANAIHNHTVAGITDYVSSTNSRIAAQLASGSINNIGDVDTSLKSDGQVLTYVSSTGKWTSKNIPASGDMFKSVYDTNNTGVVDDSERLNSQLPAFYLNRGNHTGTQDVSSITGLTKSSVGLSEVNNTSDLNKPISTAVQSALAGKENIIATGLSTDYIAGDKTIKPLNTANVAESVNKRYVTDSERTALQNISGVNTGDETTTTIKTKLGAASTTQDGYITSSSFNIFNNKENALPLGTSSQYLKGDKTLGNLDKAAVGLSNVQNIDTTNASNITSGTLDLARLNNTPLQSLAATTLNEGTAMCYVGGGFNTVPIQSTKNNIQFNLSPSSLDINSKYGNHPNNPYFNFMEHFIGTTATSTLSPYFSRVVSGGSTGTVTPTVGDSRLGVISLNTGITITGSAALSTANIFLLNFNNVAVGGYFETGCGFKIPVLSTSVETYGLILGFGDGTSAVPVDGAYLYYTTSGVTSRVVSNSVITSGTFSDGLTNLTAMALYSLKIRVTKTDVSSFTAVFTINNTYVSTITSGIPAGTGRETSLQYAITKSAGNTTRNVELDWIYFERYDPSITNY